MIKITAFHRLTFMMLGISSLIGWNAVLNSFSFFSQKYAPYNVVFLFPIPLQVANFLWGPIIPYLADRVTLWNRIFWGLVMLSVMLIVLPLLAIIAPNGIGFGLSLLCTFLIGSFNSIAQNSMIGMVSKLGGEPISIYFIATGVSGLSMNLFQMMAFGIFGIEDPDSILAGTIFFFVMACVLSAITLLCLRKVIRKGDLIDETGRILQKVKDVSTASAITDNDNDENENLIIVENAYAQESPVQELKRKIVSGFEIARSMPVIVWLIYVETFMMFPGVTLMMPWQATFLKKDRAAWGSVLILTAFNLGDVAGKQITYWRKTYNYWSATIVVVVRVLFFLIFLMIATGTHGAPFTSDWFGLLNTFLFAVTNGYPTAALMSLGPELSNDPKKKEVIGFINAFGLTFGITCGTFLALIFQQANTWSF
jgi:equilibrative nucleoside transporter 1/2/3